MSEIKRRQVLQILGATPAAAALALTPEAAAQTAKPATPPAAAQKDQQGAKTAARGPFKPKFFSAHEYATVVMLADIIIPKDERSGSASDAGVPQFIDFTMADTLADQPERLTAMRGGLKWLDGECLKRFGMPFVKSTEAQRTEVLDAIAYPKKAKPEVSHGVRFFNMFRDVVATGFWTSKMGMQDLQYIGNVPVGQWTGSPPEALQKAGVSYDE
jgi:gluconate 2-dehydrogenase gamma chain